MTPAQNAAVKAAIIANSTWNAQPNNSDGATAIAGGLNALATPAFMVWRTDAPVMDVLNAIDWAMYFPLDTIDLTTLLSNRISMINIKHNTLLILARDTVNAAKPNVRAGLREATINVPSGTSGAMRHPGGASGVNVLNACTRAATAVEKLLALPTQTTGTVTASILGYEGPISYQEVMQARNS